MSYASAFRTSRSPFFGSFFQRLKASPQNQFEAPIKRNLRIRIGRVAKVITPHSPLNQNGPNSELIAPSRHLEVPEGHVRCRTVQNTTNRTLPTSAETNSTPTPRPPPLYPPPPTKKMRWAFWASRLATIAVLTSPPPPPEVETNKVRLVSRVTNRTSRPR